MGTLLAMFFLSCQEDKLRVEGPPFLVFGETVELRAANVVKDAVLVWRIADAPAGSVDTKPSFDPSTRFVRGPEQLSVTSKGRIEGEILFVVTQERKGVRVSTTDFKLRVGPLIRVKAWCRVVENPQGGTKRAEVVRESEQRKGVEADVNRLLRPLGIEVEFELGKTVAAPDSWFDREGRFHPIVMKDGKKANSPSLQDLLARDEPGGLNVYFVRDCNWVTVQEGFPRIITDHHLIGIGLKDGEAVLDDAWDAPSLAHELGHAFGLDDLKEKSERGRLMFSLRRDRTGQAFTYVEMKGARDRARLHLKSWLARR